MLEVLSLLTLPASAVATALVVGVVHRKDKLEDGALLRRFIVVLVFCAGLIYATTQRLDVQRSLHPERQLRAEIEADPIYKALERIGPEYAQRFLAVLDAEHVTSATLPQARLQARSMLTALATDRMGFADQAARLAWGQVMLDTLRELAARSPEECYLALSGQALDRETLAHGFSAENNAAFEAASLQVLLESPGIGPGRGRAVGEGAADFNASMTEFSGIQDLVAQAYGPAVGALLSKKRFPQSPPMSANTVCAARIYQLESILKRPTAMAAVMIDAALR